MTLPTVNRKVNTDLLHPRFVTRLERFFNDSRIERRVSIVSAVRTKNQQHKLYRKYLRKGWPLAADPDRVIAPGFKGSWHMVQDDGFGYAVDLKLIWFGITKEDVARIAAEYGLQPTVPSEWWHFQPRNATGWFITPDVEEPIAIDFAGIVQYIKDLGHEISLSPLRKGSHGKAVTAAQHRLNHLGFNVGAADGRFGRKTRRGVIHFQRHTPRLVVDGVIGGRTWSMMWSLS